MPDELQKHTLNLRRGDYDYLQQVFASQGIPAAVAIRRIISRHVDYFREQETPVDIRLEPTDE